MRQDLVLHARRGVDADHSGPVQDGGVLIRLQQGGDVDDSTETQLNEGRKETR